MVLSLWALSSTLCSCFHSLLLLLLTLQEIDNVSYPPALASFVTDCDGGHSRPVTDTQGLRWRTLKACDGHSRSVTNPLFILVLLSFFRILGCQTLKVCDGHPRSAIVEGFCTTILFCFGSIYICTSLEEEMCCCQRVEFTFYLLKLLLCYYYYIIYLTPFSFFLLMFILSPY